MLKVVGVEPGLVVVGVGSRGGLEGVGGGVGRRGGLVDVKVVVVGVVSSARPAVRALVSAAEIEVRGAVTSVVVGVSRVAVVTADLIP